jgi:hypothetical protein
MWSGIKWLAGLFLGGLLDILKWIAKAIAIIVLLLCALFALGKVLDAEYEEIKQQVINSLDTNPLSKLSWKGLIQSGTDPPVLYVEPIDIVPAVGYQDPFGYQSSQIYEGYLVPLRL